MSDKNIALIFHLIVVATSVTMFMIGRITFYQDVVLILLSQIIFNTFLNKDL